MLAVALLAVGCSGGDGEPSTGSVDSDDLAIMVLPLEELGGEFAGLEVAADDSGQKDNDSAAEDTIDPEDTAADLSRAGRVDGYDLAYSDPKLTALESGTGVLEVGTSVDLFDDGDDAHGYIEKRLEDYERLRGQEVEAGLTLAEAETFDVEDIGDEARGIEATLEVGDVRVHGTIVAFRLDSLVAAAILTRADDEDVRAEVEELARALEQRIEGVVSGDISGQPVPLPASEPAASEELDLATMALSLDDLTDGASIESEGYVESEDTVASYIREFSGSIPIGSSTLAGLRSDIDVFETEGEARVFLKALAATFEGEAGRDFFLENFAASAGFEATDLRLERLDPGLGASSTGLVATFDTPVGRQRAIFLFAQVEQVAASLFMSGAEAKLDPDDVVPLLDAVRERIEAGLAAE